MNNFLNDICEAEKESSVYDIQISSIPIWRIVYRSFRDRLLLKKCGTKTLNSHRKLNLKELCKSYFISLIQISKILFSKKKYNNLLFGFPRIEKLGDYSVDKLTDPLILYTDIKESYLYFESGRSGIHSSNRLLKNNIVWMEAIDITGNILGYIISPLTYIIKYSTFNDLFRRAKLIDDISRKDKIRIVQATSKQLITCEFYKYVIKHTSAQNVFASAIMNRPALLSACLKSGINCFELQHGITEGPSAMYSGEYLPNFSPTRFLAFGKTSINPYFNVPVCDIVNIGYAFKSWIKEFTGNISKEGYLFISSLQITSELIDFILKIKEINSSLDLSIRFHPMESVLPEQIKKLEDNNIKINDNKENSNLSVLRYEGIIGEHSSVLSESISMGVKTAKIFSGKINEGRNIETERAKGFFIISDINDFNSFITSTLPKNIPEYYSDFNPQLINKLISSEIEN